MNVLMLFAEPRDLMEEIFWILQIIFVTRVSTTRKIILTIWIRTLFNMKIGEQKHKSLRSVDQVVGDFNLDTYVSLKLALKTHLIQVRTFFIFRYLPICESFAYKTHIG